MRLLAQATGLFCIGISTCAYANPYQIENTQIVEIHSQILNRDYDLYVKLPPSYAAQPTRRYPVLFLHDARYSFPLTSSITRQLTGSGRIEETIIVGISYSHGDDGDVSRTRDYTPTHSPREPIGHSTAAKNASGQAPIYFRFIVDEVFPFVAKTYRADMSNKTYAGHSFGGLFGAYVALVAPDTFEHYIISDPSLWYDSKAIFSLVQQRAKAGTQANVLLVSTNPRGDSGGFPFNMPGNARQLASALRNTIDDRRIVLEIYDDEIHETVFPIAVSHGLLRFHGK